MILVKNYRLIKQVEFSVNPDITIFVGDNDSEKTTLLEAITIAHSSPDHNGLRSIRLVRCWFNRYHR